MSIHRNTNIKTVSNTNHNPIYNFTSFFTLDHVDNIHIGINIIVIPIIYNDILSTPIISG